MTTIFTVGTGGTHATIQAAWNAIPEPPLDQYIIQLKNEEFVFSGAAIPLDISTRTTTPSNNIIIECAPGASFKDNSNVRNNGLRYNASNGAGIRCEDAPAISFGGTVNHLTIRNLQIKQAATALSSLDVMKCAVADVSTNKVIKDCLVELTGSDNNDIFFLTGTSTLINVIAIHGGNNPDSFFKLSDAASGYQTTLVNCLGVRPSNLSAGGICFHNKLDTNVYKVTNSAAFNATTDAFQLNTGIGSDYNATDKAQGSSGFPSGPAHNVYSVPFTTATFVQPSAASSVHDYRLVAGARLENAGLLDSTNAPADISGTARNSPPEIGVWELTGFVQPIHSFDAFNGIAIAGTGANVAISATALWTMSAVIMATATATIVGANGAILATIAAGQRYSLPVRRRRFFGDIAQINLAQYSVNVANGQTVYVAYQTPAVG